MLFFWGEVVWRIYPKIKSTSCFRCILEGDTWDFHEESQPISIIFIYNCGGFKEFLEHLPVIWGEMIQFD